MADTDPFDYEFAQAMKRLWADAGIIAAFNR